MTAAEKENYSYYCKKLHNDRDELFTAREIGKEEGLAEGISKGKNEEKIEIAKKMLGLGLDAVTISLATGLTKQEVESLD